MSQKTFANSKYLLHLHRGDWFNGLALWLWKFELNIQWRKKMETR